MKHLPNDYYELRREAGSKAFLGTAFLMGSTVVARAAIDQLGEEKLLQAEGFGAMAFMMATAGIVNVKNALADSRGAGQVAERHLERRRVRLVAEESWEDIPQNIDPRP